MIFLPVVLSAEDEIDDAFGGDDEMLPADFADLLDYNSLQGIWTYGQGIVQVLTHLDDELEFEEIPNSDLIAKGELNRFKRDIEDYLEKLPDGEEKDQLAPLYWRVFPDQTDIEE